MSESKKYRHTYQRPSFVWPILLIGGGVFFLLINMGWLKADAWMALVRLWPVALILLGIDILFGRRSLIGSLFTLLVTLVVVGGLIWLMVTGPEKVPGFSWLTAKPNVKMEAIQAPLGEVKTADVTIHWDSGAQKLTALPTTSKNLLEGDIEYYDNLIFSVDTNKTASKINLDTQFDSSAFLRFEWVDTNWDVALHPSVLYNLTLDTGSGHNEFDLSQLKLSTLLLDMGSGRTLLDLPNGNYTSTLEIGSGSLTISVPSDAAVRLESNQGSGSLRLPTGFNQVSGDDHNGIWETANYSSAKQQIILTTDQGSGSIDVIWR